MIEEFKPCDHLGSALELIDSWPANWSEEHNESEMAKSIASALAKAVSDVEFKLEILKGQWEVEIAENIKSLARIAELEKALEPFARAEAHEDMDFDGDTTLVEILTGSKIKLLDIRRARAVLRQGDRTD